jgi:hypothetical protein
MSKALLKNSKNKQNQQEEMPKMIEQSRLTLLAQEEKILASLVN